MQAVVLTAFGGVEGFQVQERLDPVPGPDEICVRVRAIGFNPVDVKHGITTIGELKAAKSPVRILVLSSFDDDERVLAALRAGADGYILKDNSLDLLQQAIHDVYQGLSRLHPRIAHTALDTLSQRVESPPGLTRLEITVLRLVAEGYSNQAIAIQLKISQRTAATHVYNILQKLDLGSRTQAAIYAIKNGLATG